MRWFFGITLIGLSLFCVRRRPSSAWSGCAGAGRPGAAGSPAASCFFQPLDLSVDVPGGFTQVLEGACVLEVSAPDVLDGVAAVKVEVLGDLDALNAAGVLGVVRGVVELGGYKIAFDNTHSFDVVTEPSENLNLTLYHLQQLMQQIVTHLYWACTVTQHYQY